MTATLMSSTSLSRQAEMLLVRHGVTHILPVIWEATMFEVETSGGRWTPDSVARRYLALLSDHIRGSRAELR